MLRGKADAVVAPAGDVTAAVAAAGSWRGGFPAGGGGGPGGGGGDRPRWTPAPAPNWE